MEKETERPPVGRTTEGQPMHMEANGPASFAHRDAAGKRQAILIPRTTIERLVQSGIDALDSADGDADCEPDDWDGEHDGREPENAL